MLNVLANAVLTTVVAGTAPTGAAAAVSARVAAVHQRLLLPSGMLTADGRCLLGRADLELALADAHLGCRRCPQPALAEVAHPSTFVPASVYDADRVHDATALVCIELPRVLKAHPNFLAQAEELVGNDDFHASVFFGTAPRDASSLGFGQLARRLVASIHLFEALVGCDREMHRLLARWYEAKLRAERGAPDDQRLWLRTWLRSPRDALMGGFLEVKGESVLASIICFEALDALGRSSGSAGALLDADEAEISQLLNAIMGINILEAVLSNLSFAFWPDNARAGLALLLARPGEYSRDLSQRLSRRWYELYLAWNACFIWPAHSTPDMMCFAMLLAPALSLGGPSGFGYRRAHTLFWVVRSAQLKRLHSRRAAAGQPPRFHCRQLDPPHDRQPLTSRAAVRTRADGEALAASVGENVSGAGVWLRLLLEILPEHIGNLAHAYERLPKESPGKLRL